jgi:hypothetical protein
VRRWTFQAGTRNGISAALWVRVPVRFDLQILQGTKEPLNKPSSQRRLE